MEDKKIVCKDCGNEFIFSVRDQEFYKEMNFTNEPVRCKECRDKKKNDRRNFNSNRSNFSHNNYNTETPAETEE